MPHVSTDNRRVFERVSDYYDRLVDQHGHSHRACDYGSPLSQQAKFQALAEVLDLSGRSLLDVGCGAADFADHVARRWSDVRYAGIDLSPKMVELARRLHPDLDIRHGNILTERLAPHDVVTANGIFYLLGADAPRLMEEIVAKMFEAAGLAVAFNSLSAWAVEKEAGEFYADPFATVVFCRRFTPWITLRHDYHSRDFTVYLYKRLG
jgi:cyclopropane fatty-acyl-phospholipid synthase-like methyltransferase